jgi:hypothetical protein
MIEKNNIAAAGVISAFGSRIRLGGHNPISQPRTGNQCHCIRRWVYPDFYLFFNKLKLLP